MRPTKRNSAGSRNDHPSRDDVVRVLEAMQSLNRSIRVSGRAVQKELGISSAQLLILQELAERSEQSINELAEDTYTHQSSVSTLVQRLLEKGFVRRQPSATDARRVMISITPAGRALIRKAPRTAHSELVDGLGDLSRAELRGLAQSLASVADVVGRNGQSS